MIVTANDMQWETEAAKVLVHSFNVSQTYIACANGKFIF